LAKPQLPNPHVIFNIYYSLKIKVKTIKQFKISKFFNININILNKN
jgi:hypothetical protein